MINKQELNKLNFDEPKPTQTVRRGDVFWVDLGTPTGSIQGGLRPVVIIQNDIGNFHSPTVLVVSGTTKEKKAMPTHVIIDDGTMYDPTTFMCEQVHVINKSDLQERIGRLTDSNMRKVDGAIRISLGL